MELHHIGMAGTLESSDLQITVSPADSDITFDLQSDVKKQFGEQIQETVRDVLSKYDITKANVQIVDKGALDLVIRARTAAAVERALDMNDINWEAL
ncbi:MAG: citrate lyase acyl carrier protein [Streptococcaceae bacterium]|nr:citrate lyase acyl carrier protein [Streptococcaceae bacterium]